VTLVVKQKSNIVVPASAQRKARIRPGDRLEFLVSGGVITIIPELPSARAEYTEEQRHIVYAKLEEVRQGRVSPAFASVDDLVASLKGPVPRRPRRKLSSK